MLQVPEWKIIDIYESERSKRDLREKRHVIEWEFEIGKNYTFKNMSLLILKNFFNVKIMDAWSLEKKKLLKNHDLNWRYVCVYEPLTGESAHLHIQSKLSI